MPCLAIILLANALVSSISELTDALRRADTNATFAFTATVTGVIADYQEIAIQDGTGRCIVSKRSVRDIPLALGDTVRIRGRIAPSDRDGPTTHCDALTVIAQGPCEPPLDVSLRQFNAGACDARRIRVGGTVLDAFRDERDSDWVYLVLSDDSDIAYAAFKSRPPERCDPKALVGCGIRAVGLAHPREGGARHHTGRMILIDGAAAIDVLRRPSWWTRRKVLSAFAILGAALALALAWVRALRIAAERRSQELVGEKVAHAQAESRVGERTRLAIELHDAISQNITGIALQVNAALRLADGDAAKTRHLLTLASTSLLSCRQELRNCLWDLRNQALDAPDMDEAIRQTLRPHLGDARLFVRFNVSRDKLSDDAAYAALRIIRELVSNAIRHGRATEIRIAGVALEGGRLMFSVRDNGSGFDPDRVPGSAQGHFGLQGIRERLRRLQGTLEVRSSPKHGTKATVSLT